MMETSKGKRFVLSMMAILVAISVPRPVSASTANLSPSNVGYITNASLDWAGPPARVGFKDNTAPLNNTTTRSYLWFDIPTAVRDGVINSVSLSATIDSGWGSTLYYIELRSLRTWTETTWRQNWSSSSRWTTLGSARYLNCDAPKPLSGSTVTWQLVGADDIAAAFYGASVGFSLIGYTETPSGTIWDDTNEVYLSNFQLSINYSPPPDPTISGYVTLASGSGIGGVTMTFSNGGGSTSTSSSGYYSKTVSRGWSGTATPSKSGYTFSPSGIIYSNVTSDDTSENYTGLPPAPVISGYVSENGFGITAVTVTFSNGGGSTSTNSNGYYSRAVPYGWSGTATPSKSGYIFNPTSEAYNNVTSDDSSENYTGHYPQPGISGYVVNSSGSAISGVTMTFSNGGGSTSTSSSGYYARSVPSGWSGTVTPSKSGYSFSPPSGTYSNVTDSNPGEDYTGTLATYTVSYNANGATSGSAPASQTKTHDVNLTLQQNTGSLAKNGSTLSGWNTNSSGTGTPFALGGTYVTNASDVLYAEWTTTPPLTYTVSYSANGATSGTAPAAQTKTHDVNLTLATNTGNLAKTGYSLAGWNTNSSGTGTDYPLGGTYTGNVSVTLYAKWTQEGNVTAIHSSAGYQAGGTATIQCSLAYPSGASLVGLVWDVDLASGWTMNNDASGDGGPSKDPNGNTILFTGALNANPISFSYTVNAPPGETGEKQLVARAYYTLTGQAQQSIMATPDPLNLSPSAPWHSADYQNPTWVIDAFEANRVLTYWRTGQYHKESVSPTNPDGYAAGTGAQDGLPHEADYQPTTWVIDAFEANRVLTYWRTGAYHQVPVSQTNPDGFAAGTAPRSSPSREAASRAGDESAVLDGPTSYTSPSGFTVDGSLAYSPTKGLTGLVWTVNLPDGWTISDPQGNGGPEKDPNSNTLLFTGNLASVPNPLSFSFQVTVPGGETGAKQISSTAFYTYSGENQVSIESNVLDLGFGVPAINSVISTTGTGYYKTGAQINVSLNFSDNVTLAGGVLNVILDTGAVVTIQPFVDSNSASATYTVQGGQNSADLNVTGTELAVGATLRNGAGTEVNRALPVGSNLADNSNIVVDTTAPAAPAGLDLAAADDTGASDTDNITKNTTGLTIAGTAENGSTVKIKEGSNVLNSGVVVGRGSFSIDIALAQGVHAITATATDAAGNESDSSTALTITVDTTAPTVHLSSPANGVTVARLSLNANRYIEVTFADTNGLSAATITDSGAEFALSGAGASGVTVSGAATLVSGTTYRYAFTSDFAAGVVTVNFTAGSFTDTAGNSNAALSETFTVSDNQPPQITSVSPGTGSTPSNPSPINEGQNQAFNVTATDDNDPVHPTAVSVSWYVGGQLQRAGRTPVSSDFTFTTDSDTVANVAGHRSRSKAVEVKAIAHDADGGETSGVWQATVNDVDRQPPAPGKPAIAPASAKTGDDLTTSVATPPVDPDGDAITGYEFTWTKTDRDRTTYVGNPLPHELTKKGDAWSVIAKALTNPYNDGETVSPNASVPSDQVSIGNTTPVADEAHLYTPKDTSLQIVLTGTDPDVTDGLDTLSFAIAENPEHGSLNPPLNPATGTVTYVPDSDFNGLDHFTFTVYDGTTTSTAGTVVIAVGTPPWFPLLVFNDATHPNGGGIYQVIIRRTDGGRAVETDPVLRGQVSDPAGDGTVTFGPEQYLSSSGSGRSGLLNGDYDWFYRVWNQDNQQYDVTEAAAHLGGTLNVTYDVPPAPTGLSETALDAGGRAGRDGPSSTSHNWRLGFEADWAQGVVIQVRNAAGTVVLERVMAFRRSNLSEPVPLNTPQTYDIYLAAAGQYEWCVRGFNPEVPVGAADVPGMNWSAKRPFEITAGTPPSDVVSFPTNLVPGDGLGIDASGATASVDFAWAPSANATGYHVYVGTQLGKAIVNGRAVTETRLDGVALPPGEYRWSVNAFNANTGKMSGYVTPAPQFTVHPDPNENAPGSVTWQTPVTVAVGSVTFNWVWHGRKGTSVDLLVIDATTNASVLLRGLNPDQVILTSQAVSPAATYYFKVKGNVGVTEGPWSRFGRYTMPDGTGTKVTGAADTGTPGQVAFTWTWTNRPTNGKVRLRVMNGTTYAFNVENALDGVAAVTLPRYADPGVTYHYQTMPLDASGNPAGPWSDWVQYTMPGGGR